MKKWSVFSLVVILFLGVSCKHTNDTNSNNSNKDSSSTNAKKGSGDPVLMTADITFKDGGKTLDYKGIHDPVAIRDLNNTSIAKLMSEDRFRIITKIADDIHSEADYSLFIDIEKKGTAEFTPGTYSNDSVFTATMRFVDDISDPNNIATYWNQTVDNSGDVLTTNGTVTITKLTKTHIEGTFSFKGYIDAKNNGAKVVVKNGTFKGKIWH